MVFYNGEAGRDRYGTVIAALGIDPKTVTDEFLASLKREFGCPFDKGELLIWVEASEERAEEIFEILRKRNSRL